MDKFLILTCSILMVSITTLAQEAETCANGAGTVVANKITGRKYCLSNNGMSYWNAHSWCDAQGKQLVDLNTECGCDGITACNNYCPGLADITGHYIWTSNPGGAFGTYNMTSGGNIYLGGNGRWSQDYPLCM